MSSGICFAYRKEGCTVLTETICDKRVCRFNKTKEELSSDRRKVCRRLCTLPEERQEKIADTYYGGQKIWRRGSKRI